MPRAKKDAKTVGVEQTYTVGLWMTVGWSSDYKQGVKPDDFAVWNVVEGKCKLDCKYQVTVQAVDSWKALDMARQMYESREITTEAA